jgi:RNA polymerase sigma factor (sigma-70 family)
VLRKLQDRRKYHRRERRDVGREVAPATDLRPISDTPSRKAMARETRDLLQQALAALPEPHLRIIRLIQIEGLSAAEAGERLGISTVAARSLMARALSRLGVAFQRLAGGPTTTYVKHRRPPR